MYAYHYEKRLLVLIQNMNETYLCYSTFEYSVLYVWIDIRTTNSWFICWTRLKARFPLPEFTARVHGQSAFLTPVNSGRV